MRIVKYWKPGGKRKNTAKGGTVSYDSAIGWNILFGVMDMMSPNGFGTKRNVIIRKPITENVIGEAPKFLRQEERPRIICLHSDPRRLLHLLNADG
jgi:hypothetical protein